jgi:hypothetical protein
MRYLIHNDSTHITCMRNILALLLLVITVGFTIPGWANEDVSWRSLRDTLVDDYAHFYRLNTLGLLRR